LGDVERALSPDPMVSHINPGGGRLGYELPAYTFDAPYGIDSSGLSNTGFTGDRPRSSVQDAYNNYIDLLNKTNPHQSYHVEAAMPEDWERAYIRDHPSPLLGPTPVKMEEQLTIDKLLGKIRGKR
jgi:hypothetical protein